MATLSDNIYRAITDFDDIREALIDKGQEVPWATPTSTYADKIRAIGAGWQPDPAWVKMPDMPPAGQQVLYVIVGLTENYPYVRLGVETSSGQYRVNWGDGQTTTHNSGAWTDHTYNVASIPGQVDPQGFKTALITLTAVTNGNLRYIDIPAAHTSDRGRTKKTNYYFWMRGRIPGVTKIHVSSPVDGDASCSWSSMLQCVDLTDTGSLTDAWGCFCDCASLVSLSPLDTSAVTDMDDMFSGCSSLRRIPPLDTSSAVYFSNVFSGCKSLVSIPTLNLSAATNMTTPFAGCVALQNVRFSAIRSGITRVDVSGTALSRQAIINIFNDLPTRSSGTQYIVVTGCPGTAQLSTADRQIATSKRWTVTT